MAELDTQGTSAAPAAAPAPAAPAAAPAPAAPAPAPSQTTATPADRPASFGEALTAKLAADPAPANPVLEAAASDAPPAPAPTEQAPAPTTEPAVAAPAAEAKGPVPYERHERILQNAREKVAQETVAQFQQQYGVHVELGNRIAADPVGTVVGLIETLSRHPDHGAAVVSALARALGQRRGQNGQVQVDAEPEADLQTPDGTLVYSAPQLAQWHQWNQRKFQAQIEQQIAPLQQREQARVAEERMTQARTEAMTRMSKVIEPYKKLLPDFDKHKPKLLEKTQQLFAEGFDAQTALGLAVVDILNTDVMPNRAASQQQQLVAQAVAKATGSTSAPGTSVAGTAARPKDFTEAFGRLKVS